jgi:hypothetical protein
VDGEWCGIAAGTISAQTSGAAPIRLGLNEMEEQYRLQSIDEEGQWADLFAAVRPDDSALLNEVSRSRYTSAVADDPSADYGGLSARLDAIEASIDARPRADEDAVISGNWRPSADDTVDWGYRNVGDDTQNRHWAHVWAQRFSRYDPTSGPGPNTGHGVSLFPHSTALLSQDRMLIIGMCSDADVQLHVAGDAYVDQDVREAACPTFAGVDLGASGALKQSLPSYHSQLRLSADATLTTDRNLWLYMIQNANAALHVSGNVWATQDYRSSASPTFLGIKFPAGDPGFQLVWSLNDNIGVSGSCQCTVVVDVDSDMEIWMRAPTVILGGDPAQMYSVTNGSTDRALNVTGDTLAQVAAVLGTLIGDLKGYGLLQ